MSRAQDARSSGRVRQSAGVQVGHGDDGRGRRLLLGRPGRLSVGARRPLGDLRLRRRHQGYRGIRNSQYRPDGSRRIGQSRLRSVAHLVRPAAQGVLLRGARSDAVEQQGPDVGRQYRSAIFYADDTQRSIARAYIEQLEAAKVFRRKIVTEVTQLQKFYDAEALPSGLLLQPSARALHHHQRQAQGGGAAAAVPGALRRAQVDRDDASAWIVAVSYAAAIIVIATCARLFRRRRRDVCRIGRVRDLPRRGLQPLEEHADGQRRPRSERASRRDHSRPEQARSAA